MGIKERRDRDHEEMRGVILEAARDLFLKEGYESTSIRKIAERIEYSPAAIYRYFTSKEDIFFAIAETGFRLFGRAMKAARPSPDPIETLRRRFWRYYEFSKAQPEYFALMFVDRSVPRLTREWERLEFMRNTREELSGLVAACVASGGFPAGTDPGAVFHILATAVHGAAVIRLSDRFIPRRMADALARDVLEATLAGLRQGLALTFKADVGFHGSGLAAAAPRAAAARSPAARARARPGGVGAGWFF
ncbi:MAG: TetR/AcrR family transcriptional regulator, partial [Bacteroidales bacterium]